jgi:acetyl/propionyl-CoA carboxylase alpha subunit
MIAMVIATAESRDAARQRLIAALRGFPILGVRTNIRFLINILEHRQFIAGEIDTGFLDRESSSVRPVVAAELPEEVQGIEALVRSTARASRPTGAPAADPWISLRAARV